MEIFKVVEYPMIIFFLYFSVNLFLYYKKKVLQKDLENSPLDALPLPLEPLEIKYENKYLDKIHDMSNEYVFTEEETKLYNELSCINIENAKKEVINNRLDKLSKNFIIEYTPIGNVIMTYNNKKEVFDYYSDNAIPYKYLETVLRKYLIIYNCRPLYVDMEEELKKYDDKMQLEKDKRKDRKDIIKEKKSVYAKFKNYNKEGPTGHISIAPPPKNSIQNKIGYDKNENVLLKENSNRYSRQGRISNFNILQKIDKTKINKKHSLTFIEYKQSINKV
jgi:hypothetical protein